jgi:preprotein translocase subunit SecA
VEKFEAVLADIKGCYERGQPVLVGTTSIENSEKLAAMLQKAGLPHQVLNAKQHAYEAQIIAQAGRPKMITIATNMAGRGTDIVLGGNVEKQVDVVKADAELDEAGKEARIAALRAEWRTLHQQVVDAGGLHIIGTERHESRRIDNQLRGRSGRQGDPGSSRFYLALDDQLLRIFAGERIRAIMERLKMPEGEPIEHTLVTRSIESAQRKVEAHNFDIRKQLLEYDNVANDQRKNVYELRNRILENVGVAEMLKDLRDGVVTDIFRAHLPAESVEEQWDIPGLEADLHITVGLHIPAKKWLEEEPNLGDEALLERIIEASDAAYAARMSQVPPEAVAHTERYVLLQVLDQHWREHLGALDHLRQGIHLRGYAQKNPKQEYKREAFELFGAMLETVKLEATRILTHLDLKTPEQVREIERLEAEARAPENVQYQHPALEEALVGAGAEAEPGGEVATLRKPAPFVRQMGKVGRNDPCPCGSGKKFKHCHGRLS